MKDVGFQTSSVASFVNKHLWPADCIGACEVRQSTSERIRGRVSPTETDPLTGPGL